MTFLGDFVAGQTVNAYLSTNNQSGAAVTMTSATVRVYKDNGTSYDSTHAAISTNVDSQTGFHRVTITTSGNASFYAAGSEFAVVVAGTVDSQSARAVVGKFSIQKVAARTTVDQNLGFVKKNTATTVAVGPFINASTGLPATTLTASNLTCKLINGVTSSTLSLTGSGGDNDFVHIANGVYSLELTATNTNSNGRSVLVIQDDDVVIPYTGSFSTIRANSFDSLVAETDVLQADVTQVGGSAVTSASGVLAVNTTQIAGDAAAATALDAAIDNSNNVVAVNVKRIDDSTTSATNLSNYTDGTSNQPVDVTKISGDSNAADRLEGMMDGCEIFAVDSTSFTPTTTAFESTATEATADHYNDKIVLFISGPLAGQQKVCTDYVLSGGRGKFTVNALTEAPASGNQFILV
jgi:hypothetical protein